MNEKKQNFAMIHLAASPQAKESLNQSQYSSDFQKLLLMDYYLDTLATGIGDFQSYISSESILKEYEEFCMDENTPPAGSQNTIQKCLDRKASLSAWHLDSESKKSVPFEITLFDKIDFSGLINHNWRDVTEDFFEKCFSGEFTSASGHLKIYELNASCYTAYNSHLKYHLNPQVGSFAKIKSVSVFSLEGKMFFGGVRIQFDNRLFTLQDVVNIMKKLPHLKQDNDRANYFKSHQRKFTPSSLIKEIFSKFLDECIKFTNQRTRRFVFIRTEAGIFENNELCKDIFNCVASFGDHILESPCEDNFDFLNLDYDAVISLSEKGSVAFCGPAPKNNSDFLPNEFMRCYFANYILAWFYHIMKNKQDKQESFLEKILEKKYKHLYQRKYLNRYSEIACTGQKII